MIVLNQLPDNLTAPVVTMGSFDGVHLGHSSILKRLKAKANEYGGESVVVTFSPHPRVALGLDVEDLFFLNTLEEKTLLLEEAGVDYLVVLPFTRELSVKTQEQFFMEYFVERLKARALIVGYNHRFGSDKNSNHESLQELAWREYVELVVVDKAGVDECNISSTNIRNLLSSGEISRANTYLGYDYFFLATLGNDGSIIYMGEKKLFPPDGIYDVRIEFDGNKVYTKVEICNKMHIKNISRNCLFLSQNEILKAVKLSFIR